MIYGSHSYHKIRKFRLGSHQNLPVFQFPMMFTEGTLFLFNDSVMKWETRYAVRIWWMMDDSKSPVKVLSIPFDRSIMNTVDNRIIKAFCFTSPGRNLWNCPSGIKFIQPLRVPIQKIFKSIFGNKCNPSSLSCSYRLDQTVSSKTIRVTLYLFQAFIGTNPEVSCGIVEKRLHITAHPCHSELIAMFSVWMVRRYL